MDKYLHLERAVVLEMPLSMWDSIIELRLLFEPWRARLPVEITLVGSSGVGPIAAGQSCNEVTDAVTSALGDLGPVEVKFRGVSCFPNVSVYYLDPEDNDVFVQMHNKIANSGLIFREIPFPNTPHCTICALENPSPNQYKKLSMSCISPA